MPNPSLWIVEDDPGCVFVYQQMLKEDYQLLVLENLEAVKQAIAGRQNFPDMVIADLKLPDGQYEFFLASEQALPILHIPYMIVSSTDDEETLKKCLESGASDYLTKPFNKTELKVKISRILSQAEGDARSGPNLVVDPIKNVIRCGDKVSATLTPRELQIFIAIFNHPVHQISRPELIETVWRDVKVGSRTLDVHLYNLRRKLRRFKYDISFNPPDKYYIEPMIDPNP